MSAETVQSTKVQALNWGRFSLELFLGFLEEDMMQVSEIIELPGEKKLHMMLDGRPPTCYECELKEHINKTVPLTYSE